MTARMWGWTARMHAATTKVAKRVLGPKGTWEYIRYSTSTSLWVGYKNGSFETFEEKIPFGPAAMIALHRQANAWLENQCTKQLVAEQEMRKHRTEFSFNRKGERRF